MIVKINSEEELISVAEELIHVLANLRKFSRLWQENHGAPLLRSKKYFEEKADELIERLQVKEHRNPYEVKIKIGDE